MREAVSAHAGRRIATSSPRAAAVLCCGVGQCGAERHDVADEIKDRGGEAVDIKDSAQRRIAAPRSAAQLLASPRYAARRNATTYLRKKDNGCG